MLLTKKNLRIILAQAKPFVIPLLPWLAPPTLMSSEYFVMKDLPFYEVTRFADAEARQACLDTREKKCQEETLRQALSSTSQVASNSTCWLVKKKTIV